MNANQHAKPFFYIISVVKKGTWSIMDGKKENPHIFKRGFFIFFQMDQTTLLILWVNKRLEHLELFLLISVTVQGDNYFPAVNMHTPDKTSITHII